MQMKNAKPKSFSRVEGLVSDMLSNPIVPSIGTAFASYAATEKKHCTRKAVLDLALV